MLLAAELPTIRFQNPRHTAATLILAQGVDPRTIMEALLGVLRADVDQRERMLQGMFDPAHLLYESGAAVFGAAVLRQRSFALSEVDVCS